MELMPVDIERNMKQFHVMALRSLENAAKKGHNEYRNRSKKEVTFSEMPAADMDKLFVLDEYFHDDTIFHVLDFDIVVSNPMLSEALMQLPEHKRNILLLKYFLRWTDQKIGEAYAIRRATIQYQRTATLKKLKELLEEGERNE